MTFFEDYFCGYKCFACMHVCVPHACLVPLEPRELEFWWVFGNPPLQYQQGLLTAELSLKPLKISFTYTK